MTPSVAFSNQSTLFNGTPGLDVHSDVPWWLVGVMSLALIGILRVNRHSLLEHSRLLLPGLYPSVMVFPEIFLSL